MFLFCLGFAGCQGSGDPYSHVFEARWTSDETNHWKKCTDSACVVIGQKAAHTWDSGVVTKEPAGTKKGVRIYTCTVCGRTKEVEEDFFELTFINSGYCWHDYHLGVEKDGTTTWTNITSDYKAVTALEDDYTKDDFLKKLYVDRKAVYRLRNGSVFNLKPYELKKGNINYKILYFYENPLEKEDSATGSQIVMGKGPMTIFVGVEVKKNGGV